jgi:hypothetical protein
VSPYSRGLRRLCELGLLKETDKVGRSYFHIPGDQFETVLTLYLHITPSPASIPEDGQQKFLDAAREFLEKNHDSFFGLIK